MLTWKIQKSEMAIDHRWYKLRRDWVELPDGRAIDDYFVSVRPDVALILALTPDGNVPLVRQYKHGAQKVLLELPGGFIDEGETPRAAAARELLEETGYAAERFELLGQVHDNPTKDTNTDFLFFAANAVQRQAQSLDPNEQIYVELAPFAQLPSLILDGSICVGNSISTIFFALHRLGFLKRALNDEFRATGL